MIEKKLISVVVKIAGDSGDGIQLIGGQLTKAAAISGNDLSTFPDFPAEIRAPQGTRAGVSGFQINFGSIEIDTPGDRLDVLVALNAAAYSNHISRLNKGGILIIDENGFDAKNIKLASQSETLLEDIKALGFEYHIIPITTLTKEALKSIDLNPKEKDRCKNMFVLGLIFWLFEKNIVDVENQLKEKFIKQPDTLEANIAALKAGYHYGDTVEIFSARYPIEPATFDSGQYRNIFGNQALSYGLMAASSILNRPLFYASYPITPASDILHELAKFNQKGVQTYQAEDEIAAVMAAIGAAFGGNLGVTCTSGPGMDLKAESIGLAMSMEIPLIVIDVQRAGPSTGMPTKTEQSDLLMSLYGRHGECPVPILAAYAAEDCFEKAILATKIAYEWNTPVILLSDAFLANNSAPWLIPSIHNYSIQAKDSFQDSFFERDANLIKPFVPFGNHTESYRIGGIEKDFTTGNISYDGKNHQKMIDTRQSKIDSIASILPKIKIEGIQELKKMAIIGWGSSYGSLRHARKELEKKGIEVDHIHFELLNPFALNTEEVLRSYQKILVCELNNGQLIKLIREKFLLDAKGLNKTEGSPFYTEEICDAVLKVWNA